MSVSGLSPSTLSGAASVSGDGVDDVGRAQIKNDLFSKQFGIAFVGEWVARDLARFIGVRDPPGGFEVRQDDSTGTQIGNVSLFMEDDTGQNARVATQNDISGQIRTVIINKLSDSFGSGGVEIYIDDMTTAETLSGGGSVDSSNITVSAELGLFANSTGPGSISGPVDLDATIFEINSQPYTESERQGFKSRAPGV
jgi:hypothetical protein